MGSFSHILAATDLTGRSVYALQRAIQIKKESESKLTVLHVVEHGLTPHLRERYYQDAVCELEQWKRALPEAVQFSLNNEVLFGDPFATLVDRMRSDQVELGILGGPGKGGVKELFAGTTIERVVRFSEKPVLMVTQHASGPYRRAVVAVDFSVSAQRALQCACRVAPDAEICLVHAWQPAVRGGEETGGVAAANQRLRDQEVGQLRELIAGIIPNRTFELQIIEDEPCTAIRKVVARINAQVLVMGTHGRGRIAAALIGSAAQEMLATPPCDVLVVKG